jgi:hypothetical protein
MSSAAEYLFAASFSVGDQAARKQGWRPCGRTAWQKPDGVVVYFICLTEQLAAVPAGVTLHVVGKAPSALRSVKRKLVKLAG